MALNLIRPPLHSDVKEAVKKALENGDQKAIAQLRKADPSDISRYFNPDNKEYQSAIWLAVCEVCDGLNTRDELGEEWQATFNRFCDAMKEQKLGPKGNATELWKKARKSAYTFLDDGFSDLPRATQIRMLEKAESDLANYRRAKIRAELVTGYEEGVLESSEHAS